MPVLLSPTAQPVILDSVSWEVYASLLRDAGDSPAARLTYDQGRLEIMAPSFAHEELKHLLALLVELLASALQVDLVGAGSTTFKRADIARGFEPDASFYIQHAAAMRGKTVVDLSHDPPPDLVIEIDINHPSLEKLPLYAAMGIPEVWRYDGQYMFIYQRTGDGYRTNEVSAVLPGVTAANLTRLLTLGQQLPRPAWLAAVHAGVPTPRRTEGAL